MVGRVLILAYGTASYALCLVALLYGVGFIGGFVTPTTLDAPRQGSVGVALAVDLGLIALFALQHSGMARPAFKRWWTQYIPKTAERSTYVLLSSLALLLLFWCWRPIGGVVWAVEDAAGRAMLYTVFAVGWVIVLTATFLINHFDLFGLRQVWLQFRGRPYTPLRFKTPVLYRVVRHPLYVGWLLAFWGTPQMTSAHLVFAAALTAYILAAIQWEERDLAEAHPEYAAYRRRVPMLIPRWRSLAAGADRTSLTTSRRALSWARRSTEPRPVQDR
ncbi:methanethiol S-methyltransferase [Paludisphaera rhizosphaerae]|uniref:methanethiol S-methyltransferase n=1 Tax=Paludisphaera rhizosphaerae TaxID=2711216 RepID=UPI0013E9D8C8|nr:methanethiol S-methyltransferase [Paludisphaera rhizosphaerae]